ncbi:MAG: Hsp33 family molecular chaperone HslO, partial [Kiritimatiellaeota bacterium]|nr:Hsp33 family molecular chaperone HslO [Kiritimatiellota bacterium]
MVKSRINDCCMEGYAQTGDFGFPETEARIIFADVTDTAVRLQQRHDLDYPAAAELGRAIAAAALLGVDFRDQNDTITLCAETNAPIGGWLAEITGKGALRGYVYNPDAWDASFDPPRAADPVWTRAKLTRTDADGDVIGQVSFGADSADMAEIMSSYYNSATRVNPRLAFCAVSHDNDRLDRVRALGVQYIENPNHPRLSRIAPLFKSGAVARQIEVDASTGAL